MTELITDILSGDLETMLGADLFAQTVSKIVIWWAVLPMVGIVLAFCGLLVGLFGGGKK